MLKDDFFSIVAHSLLDSHTVDFQIKIHKNHAIYKGHFPGNPVTPGVCIIQMARELFVFFKQEDFLIKKIKSVKFTQTIIPTLHETIHYRMEWEDADSEHLIRLKATVYSEDIVFTKINMQLKAI
ncbi:MAG: hypothetical protein LBH82_05160 [Bacteroidales bacterium]|jgi:3-hydroxyacyl-[acyl-carrier-protein] dehydratase|nr:hypothetical protein [Bacteroidales bacterium]